MKLNKLKAYSSALGKIPIPDRRKALQTITSEISRRRILTFENEVPYIWHDGQRIRITDSEAKMIIFDLFPDDVVSDVDVSEVNEILERCRKMISLQIDTFSSQQKGEFYVNTLDGLYDIHKQRIVPMVDDFEPDNRLNFHYKPKCKISDAPVFEKFVNMSIGMKQLTILLQVLGSCISSLMHCRAIFLMVGIGGSGKSTILEVLESIFPEDLVVHEPLHNIGNQQAKARYRGKRINIGRDTTAKPIGDEESIKNLASCEWTSSRELYKTSVDYIPVLKFIYASNHFPQFKHPDDALLDRLVFVVFPNTIPESEKDPLLKEKLLAERDVIFSMALDSLKGLIDSNYHYEMGAEAQAYLTQQRLMLHSVEAFIAENLEFSPGRYITSKDLCSFYEGWCHDNAITPLGKSALFDKLSLLHPEIKHAKVGPENGRKCGFIGVALKAYAAFSQVASKKEE